MINFTEIALTEIKRALASNTKIEGIQIGVSDRNSDQVTYYLKYIEYMGPYTPYRMISGIQVYIDPDDEADCTHLKVDYIEFTGFVFTSYKYAKLAALLLAAQSQACI